MSADYELRDRGPRFKKFIPCMEGECPERMQLMGEATNELRYRCMRRVGYKGRPGVTYTSDCYFHEHPLDAMEVVWWHRDPDAKRQKHGQREAPTREEWETAV